MTTIVDMVKNMDEETKRRALRLYWLRCCCCDKDTIGRQWWNRDNGYGVCEDCVDGILHVFGDYDQLYGYRGIHFCIPVARHTPYVKGQSRFHVGDRVKRKAFTDCYGNDVPEIPGLTATSVKLINTTDTFYVRFGGIKDGNELPSYYRIEAAGDTCPYTDGAERFFDFE